MPNWPGGTTGSVRRPEGDRMIVVLTRDGDVHADAVEAHLRKSGSAVIRFDPADYPAHATLSLSVAASGRAGAVLRCRDVEVDLAAVEAIWVRRPNQPRAAAAFTGTVTGELIESEAAALLSDVWELLEVPFVPATPLTLMAASLKVRQLTQAVRLGFEIPATVVTNDPDAFLDHYEATGGGL